MDGVALHGVSCRHADGTFALDDVTLHVPVGERLGLLGPSGSGKTTLLRVVAGLTPPSSGTVRIRGVDVTGAKPGDRGLGYVAQDAPLLSHLDVGGNLAFGPKVRREDRDEVRSVVGRVAATLGLTPLLPRRIRTLSHGAKREVSLGRATASDAGVLLLDEPLAGLDPAERERVLVALARHQTATRATVLFATHDETDLWRFTDRVAVLAAGRLRQVAPLAELLERPADVDVATLVGTPPMALLPAVVELVGRGGGAIRVAGQRLWVTALPAAGRVAEGVALTLGVRRARLLDDHTGAGDGPRLRGEVRTVARLGPRDELAVAVGDITITAAASRGSGVRIGEVVDVVLDEDSCRWFDPVDGRALER